MNIPYRAQCARPKGLHYGVPFGYTNLNQIRVCNIHKFIPTDKLLLETDAPFTIKISSTVGLKNELLDVIGCISVIHDEDFTIKAKENSIQIWETIRGFGKEAQTKWV